MKIIVHGSLILFSSLLVSCGSSETETSLREKEILDSVGKVVDSISKSKVNSSSKINASSGYVNKSEDNGKEGTIEFNKLKLSYNYDKGLFNKKADVDCKVVNNSAYTFENFVLKITCYDNDGIALKSLTKTANERVKPNSSEKFTISFDAVKKTKKVKVDLLKATQVD